MEAQLVRYELQDRYRRFSAADGNTLGLPTYLTASEMGCFTSHYLVLKDNLDCPTHWHVVEDDVMFSRITDQVIRSVVSSNLMDRYDIVFLDSVIPNNLGNNTFRAAKQLYDKCVVRDDRGNV
jgi:GR25 family glycosyltransferase involved in LPS biosynthesis